MKSYVVFSLCYLVYLGGCVTTQSHQELVRDNLKLPIVEGINPGTTTKQEILELFGTPTRETNLEELDSVQDSGIVWGYDDGNSYDQLSLFFEKNSNTVASLVWKVRDGDLEEDLRQALARYKDVNWISENELQTIPHVTPKICYFTSEKRGISIEFNRERNEVVTISWSDPTRDPAEEKKQKKEEISCIGGHCFKYDPSKLTWQEPPCKIPK